MTDPTTFETRLAEAFGRYADRMPVEVDAAAVVGWAAVDRARARRRWPGTWLGPRLVPVVLGLLALAALAGAIMAGSLVLRSEPISVAPPSIAPSGLTPVAPSGPVRVTATGGMLTPRTRHAAVRLLDGRVLIVGGTALGPLGPRDPVTGEWPTSALASAELWDPATGRFSATGRMAVPREDATVTLLDDGRVLIAGGTATYPGGRVTAPASTELYDPVTGTFSATGSMLAGRGTCHCGVAKPGLSHPAAAKLVDGRVFIAGGQVQGNDPNGGPPGDYADIYDPRTGTFGQTPPIPCNTTRTTVTALLDARALVICTAGAVIWDPSTNQFAATAAPRMTYPGAATRLPDGQVLLTAPVQAGMAPPAEVYDPATGTFGLLSEVASPGRIRFVLPDGRLLLAADSFFASDGAAQAFDPTTDTTVALERPLAIPDGTSFTLLLDGRVLIAGGDRDDATSLPSLLVEPARRP